MKPRGFDPSLRLLATPLILIVFALVILYILISSALPSVNVKLSQIKESKTRVSVLEERLAILKQFRSGVIDDKTDLIYTVFPDKNPASLNISQMKLLAAEDEIIIKGFTFDKEGSNALIKQADVTYDIEAKDLATLVRFLTKLEGIAPISRITEVEFAASKLEETKITAKLTENIYWASLPTGLPPLTQPITDLTNEEVALLNKIYGYRLPQYNTLQPETQNAERLNPFN